MEPLLKDKNPMEQLENFFSEDCLTYKLLEEIVSSSELFKEWKKKYTTSLN